MPQEAIWAGRASVKGTSEFSRMVLLTFSLLGLQLCWGLEMTYCMPYLLELGLTKSKTSIVWIAGPLSGILTAPIIGAVADRSRSKYGRRRPFMLGGSFVVAACFYVLGWTREVVAALYGEETDREHRGVTIFLAILSIWAVDFAINVVQWCCRSLIVDTLPVSKQQTGSAYASRITAFGHLFGYAVGATDLKKTFGPLLGDTQFKQMTFIAALSLIASVSVTCWAVREKVLVAHADSAARSGGPVATLQRIFGTLASMPPRMRAICAVQFWAWIGWFPFMFYSSTWVGETYFRHEAPGKLRASTDRTGDVGRIGSMALVIFSTVNFIGAIFLPWLVKSPADEEGQRYTARPPSSLAPVVEEVQRKKPDLLTAWFYAHLLFAGSMVMAPFVTSVKFATILVAFCGIPWTVGSWAPFAFMGVEINKMSRVRGVAMPGHKRGFSDVEKQQSEESGSGGRAGIYLGILNLFTAGPQLCASLISMVVFAALEPEQAAGKTSEDGPNAIAVCLFIGSMAAIGAAYAASRLSKMGPT